jgi:hypothetical protein
VSGFAYAASIVTPDACNVGKNDRGSFGTGCPKQWGTLQGAGAKRFTDGYKCSVSYRYDSHIGGFIFVIHTYAVAYG